MLIDISNAVSGYLLDVFNHMNWWILVGFIAQILFGARFFVQWVASERAGKSVVPVAFWFFSLGGGIMLFTYAVVRKDPVFIAGQGFGLFVYMRNLYFIFRYQRVATATQ
jgi:lipid-A-disaccharide synthase-like uncharacterized protein